MRWSEAAYDVLVFLGLYGAWRCVRWFIESRRATIPWRALKHGVPSATLVGGWVLSWMTGAVENGPHAVAAERIAGFFYTITFPGVAGAGASIAAFNLIHDMDKAPVWERLIAGSVGWWLAWYGVVRFLEWRAWANEPAMLDIRNP